MNKPCGQLLAFPGATDNALDLDALFSDDNVEEFDLERGQRVRFQGQLWTVDETPHCYDDVLVLVQAETGRRWCQVHGEIPLEENTSTGPYGDGAV